jgi:spermidine/putrescine transport system substrate-binding protein
MTDHITRRQLLERAAIGGAAITFPGILAACGGNGTKAGEGTTTVEKKLAKTLRMSNWTLYIDVKGQKHPTLDQFEKKTGVHVNYKEDINGNAEFFGKVQGPLRRGQSIDRDIIVMTDNSRYPSLLINQGWVEKLDKSAIPNMKNLIAQQRHPSWDPDREYSLPWQSGMTGIGYNAKLTDPVMTMDDLLTNPKLKGKVGVLDDYSGTLTLMMLSNGDDPGKVTDATFNRVIKRLQKASDSGQIRRFYGNDYSDAFAKGDLAATMAWSGDVVQLALDNKNLHWGLPTEGGEIWTDNMLIPQGGDVYTASVFMNYVYNPKVAAQIEAYVNYICPVAGAREAMLKMDASIAKNTLIFPTKQMLDNAHSIDPKTLNNEKYLTTWNNLISA